MPLPILFRRLSPVLPGACLLLALALPFLPGLSGPYPLQVATLTLVYMVLALGLNIVPGFTGLLNLGYVGFYGIGAYTAGLLTLHLGAPFWVVTLLAAANGALFGVLLGAPTLRLTGDYFAIVTFGFSELVVLVITNEIWLTRGPMGLPGIPPPAPFGRPLDQPWQFYLLALGLLLAVLFVVGRVERSRLGRAWFAIREDDVAAVCSGINVTRYKIAAFALSAAVGASAGAFFARWFLFLSPDMFKFWDSILILCLIVFGGMGSVRGVLLGTAVLVPMTELLRAALPQVPAVLALAGIRLPPGAGQNLVQARYLVFGLLLVLMMRFRPEGLLPTARVRGEMHPAGEEREERFWRDRAPDEVDRV